MDIQSKQDLAAAGAIILMFLGAFLLPLGWVGLLLMGIGAISIVLLMLKVLRHKH